MAVLYFPSMILGLSLWVFLVSPAHSLTCTSQNLTSNKVFEKCADLPTLDSYLHYTYDSSNSSLSIAFVATPNTSDGWIAWAINPTGTGMVGSQALLAFKSNGSMVVKTYNISGYHAIDESKLSFEVWDQRAESSSDGKMTILASVKVPEKAEKLNQVWQVGSKVTNGKPERHAFANANLQSKGSLQLVAAQSPTSTPTPAPATGGAGPDGSGVSRISNNCMALVLGLFLFFGSV